MLAFFLKVWERIKNYEITFDSNEKLWENATHKACDECSGSGLECFFYDCEKCGGTGKLKKTYQEVHNLKPYKETY